MAIATTIQTKRCYKCQAVKPFSDFQLRSDSKDGLQGRCRPCSNADKYAWYYRNTKQATESSRNWQLRNREKCRGYAIKSRYKVPIDYIKELVAKQGNVCAICRTAFAEWDFDIDHDHATGKVRGVLCRNCNTGLGRFRDNKELLKTALEYLG